MLSGPRLSLATGSVVPRPATTGEADLQLKAALDSLDGARNYACWIRDMVRPYLGSRLLEIGAGHGTMTDLFVEEGRSIVATDISVRCTELLKDRFESDPGIHVVQGGIDQAVPFAPFDSAVLINVLEHIHDDEKAISQLQDLLQPGGRIILWVPAHPRLYSEFDRRVGHFRRYRLADIRMLLERATLEIEELRYCNAIGALGWWVVACTLGRDPTQRSGLDAFDHYAVPLIRRLESRVSPPFGQSILAVARRPR